MWASLEEGMDVVAKEDVMEINMEDSLYYVEVWEGRERMYEPQCPTRQ